MSESKYGKYIVTEPKPEKVKILKMRMKERGLSPDEYGKAEYGRKIITYMDDEYMKGAFYFESHLVWKPFSITAVHFHDFDEYICFNGTNPEDPHDLNGEVKITLGDEDHVITKSCAVFIPKGLIHLPIIFKRVERPIVFFTAAPVPVYGSTKL